MLVIAHHFVHNPNTFWSLKEQVISSIPSGVKLHSVFPSTDLKTGTCIWEAPNADKVQEFLDKLLGQYSKNVCYEVNEEIAFGLPQKTLEKTFS